MARLPDLIEFAQAHGLKIGTIADLIHFRSQTESLVERVAERDIDDRARRVSHARLSREALRRDPPGARARGDRSGHARPWCACTSPLSMLDLLDTRAGRAFVGVHEALAAIGAGRRGVIVLLNCAESAAQLAERVAARPSRRPRRRWSCCTYGIGAQILRDLNVGKMRLMATPRKMPSMTGYDLEVTGFIEPPLAKAS